jgi:predicted DCC family thiol-disulfide oxidoreductase YuxK
VSGGYARDVGQAVIVYDDDCGFCRWALARILAWDRQGALRPVPLSSSESVQLLPGMHEEQREASWHLITGDGEVYSAGAAVAPLARLLPHGAPVAAIADAAPGFTGRAYRLVARHRSRLGRLLGVRACSVDPTAIRPS